MYLSLVPSPNTRSAVFLFVFIGAILSMNHLLIYIHATRNTHVLRSKRDVAQQGGLVTSISLVTENVTMATRSNKHVIPNVKHSAENMKDIVPETNGHQSDSLNSLNIHVSGKEELNFKPLPYTRLRKTESQTTEPKSYKNMDGNKNRNSNWVKMTTNRNKNKNETDVQINTQTLLQHVKPLCRDLIAGNTSQIQQAILYSKAHPYKPSLSFTDITRNCTRFLNQRGYIMRVSAEETGFPLAFSILMYKDVEQVERLLRAIYRPSNYYCVHVDKKMYEEDFKATKAFVDCLPNVSLASVRINVRWGTYSVLKADLKCMKDLWAYRSWKYFINLSGTEFPLKTNREIVRILKTLNGANIVDAEKEVEKWKHIRWGRAGPPPVGISLHKGNTHVLVSREFVGYALHSPLVRKFKIWLRKTRIPDETFFPSLNHSPLLRSPGSFIGEDYATDYDNKPYIARFKNWGPNAPERSFAWPCHGKRVREICIFGVGDLPLLTTRRELFANKFYINYQSQTLDCLEEWLSERTREEQESRVHLNVTFYEHMPNLKYICRQNCTGL
ncbi:beta-1,3-galactosyl-O-glycosyl-glycoprotein beta-1,6-N-acetylglucosaminyltransferase-like [Haliotis asinina]|uniref:beta-1,3-galactosyl-O-glycosyl-glycoprotein beta-1,6-N-acetylglucosaminyltransferase-like n=1 Tax=Haliotis asinina TaxID=109174 RepID=UPI003531FFE8